MQNNSGIASLLLRIAIGVPYVWFSMDRLGLLGGPGQPHVGWGDWSHFVDFAATVMSFLPRVMVEPLAVIATIGEVVFGLLLIIGWQTRLAAVGSALLSLMFALSMAISSGIESPFAASVFALSAGSFMLATVPEYKFSIDSLRRK